MKKDKILKYFSYPSSDNDGNTWKSPYMAALIDARVVTARNRRTGRKLNREHGCWLGALGYMALIEHVGGIIKLRGEDRDGNNFLSALKYFTNLSDKERKALYALRCSFAHNYQLYNINKREKDKMHHFTVTSGSENNQLIILPKEQWCGSHKTKRDQNRTIINLELFGDLVEEMHNEVIKKVKSDSVEIIDNILINTYIVY